MPCCDTAPHHCSDQCEVVPHCEGCDRNIYLPCVCPIERRPTRLILKCWRHPRMGVMPADIGDALTSLGEPASVPHETPAEQKLRLCLAERRLETTHLLKAFGREMEPGEDKFDRVRENALRDVQMQGLRLFSWCDGTPMLNRSWTVYYWTLVYDPRIYALSDLALRECRRPRLHIVVRCDDNFSETSNIMRRRNEDLQTLNEAIDLEQCGLRVHATVAGVKRV